MLNNSFDRYGLAALPVLVALILLGPTPGAIAPTTMQAQGSSIPATAQFTGSLQGSYADKTNCAIGTVSRSGDFFLRTVAPDCQTGFPITLVLSGGNPCFLDDAYGHAGSLNLCGSSAIPDMRVLVSSLFKSTSGTTRVSLLFSLEPDFQGRSDFELQFASVPFSGSGNTRVLTASGLSAWAPLYRYRPQGNRDIAEQVGKFSVPFTLTVTRQP